MNAAGAPVVLFAVFGGGAEPWLKILTPLATDFELRVWPDAGSCEEVDYVITWAQPDGFLTKFPNLKGVHCTGAGIDRLLADPQLPDVPIARMVDDSLLIGMNEFVLAQALHYHRAMPAYRTAQAAHAWTPIHVPLARERTVGIMGLGQLGIGSARTLSAAGFTVRGWSRTVKSIDGMETFDAPALPQFLRGCDILVCLLPLTAQTEGILNAGLFSNLSGASLINVGRGGHLVEADLIPALDCGHLAAATLDVFRAEPLPADSPFWDDPRVTITPHASAFTHPETAAVKIVANLRRAFAGKPMRDLIDHTNGY